MEEESLAQQLVAMGFSPGDGEIWTDPGSAVGAVLGSAGVFVGWLDVRWPGAGPPEPWLRKVTHLPPGQVERGLFRAVAKARSERDAHLDQCRFCRERHVPGRMHSADICHGCAAQELGLVN